MCPTRSSSKRCGASTTGGRWSSSAKRGISAWMTWDSPSRHSAGCWRSRTDQLLPPGQPLPYPAVVAALALTLAYLVFNRFPGWQTFGTVVVALVALLTPLLRRRCAPAAPDSRADRLGRWLRKPAPLIVIPSLVAFIATASLALHRGLPLPYVHDEASYLLAADTFAHGRLTNPSPAVPEPFETMHVLVRPSYQSKYPPAQGLFMALGQVIFGHPIWGVWISG